MDSAIVTHTAYYRHGLSHCDEAIVTHIILQTQTQPL